MPFGGFYLRSFLPERTVFGVFSRFFKLFRSIFLCFSIFSVIYSMITKKLANNLAFLFRFSNTNSGRLWLHARRRQWLGEEFPSNYVEHETSDVCIWGPSVSVDTTHSFALVVWLFHLVRAYVVFLLCAVDCVLERRVCV